jgi:isoleucyl-tRNA synthetase
VTPAQAAAFAGLSLAEIAITSSAEIVVGEPLADAFRLEDVAGVGVVPRLAEGGKCQRCWRILPEVGRVPGHDELCARCAEAVSDGPLAGQAA